jgi:HSP20 family molecular chaperone IbpA
MSNIFNELMFLGLGEPTGIKFNTPNTKDIRPASYWKKVEDGYQMIARVVGINPEDINITMEEYGICLDGKTDDEGTVYTQHIELPISKDLMANITDINYEVKNGLCKIKILVKEPEYKKVNIQMIK